MSEKGKRIGLTALIVVAALAIVATIARPSDWGEIGHYRTSAIDDELKRAFTNRGNSSCRECHENIYELKGTDAHKTLECEGCHGAYSAHIDAAGKKFADMPASRKERQIELCLACHKHAPGRSTELIKLIYYPAHLRDQNVRLTHTCDQCHTVHAPLETIKRSGYKLNQESDTNR